MNIKKIALTTIIFGFAMCNTLAMQNNTKDAKKREPNSFANDHESSHNQQNIHCPPYTGIYTKHWSYPQVALIVVGNKNPCGYSNAVLQAMRSDLECARNRHRCIERCPSYEELKSRQRGGW